jgi:hypothetical protein
MRRSVTPFLAVLVCVSASLAEDYTGKIKNLDVKKREVTVIADGKDVTFPIDKDVSVFYEAKGKKKGQPSGLEPVPGGLSSLKTGSDVTLTTEKKNDTETVTLIHLMGAVPETKPKK